MLLNQRSVNMTNPNKQPVFTNVTECNHNKTHDHIS